MCKCKKSNYLSLLYIYHYLKLAFRTVLFGVALAFYIVNKSNGSAMPFGDADKHPVFWSALWIFFFAGMVLRIFPSKLETIGCQKQLKRNYVPTGEEKPSLTPSRSVLVFTLCWVALNLLFGALYLLGVYDAGILVLITLAYGVCDIVCILFFCPIRDWFLKNKCCADCRIYNWDYAMMFTPFFFIPHPYTWSLLGLSLVLLLIWEIMYKLYPERFAKNTNASLACQNCKEKPCRHKKRIARIMKKGKEKLARLSWWKSSDK
jgi:hypothetical protein